MDRELQNALDQLIANNKRFCASFESRLEAVELATPRPRLGTGVSSDLGAERGALARFARSGDDSDLRNFRNSMSVGEDPGGGYLTVPALSETMTKRLFDLSPMRRLSRVITITAGSEWQEPVDLDESGATWASENQGRPATDTPQLGLLTVPVSEIYALQVITQRLLDDSYVDLGEWIEGKISEKFGRSEGSAAVTGDGVGKLKGMLSYSTSTDSDATRAANSLQHIVSGAANAVTGDGLRDAYWTLRAPHRANGTWLMASATANAIDKLKSGDGEYLWRNGMTAGAPPSLLGRPVEFSEDMPAIAAGALPIAFGDFKSGYTIVDKAGIRFLRDPFTNRPNVNFYAYRRTGGSVANFDAIKLLKIST